MNQNSNQGRRRVGFLFLFAMVLTGFLLWTIKDFLIAVTMGAVLAALLFPLYNRILILTRQRKSLASGLTVLLSLILIIVPLLLFLGMVTNEALNISEIARDWLADRKSHTEGLQATLESNAQLRQLLPYQDTLVEKANQLAGKMGTWVAQGLAAGASGTADFFLSLFILLFATFYFLIDGRELFSGIMRYSQLSQDDMVKLSTTFISVSRATLKGKLVIGILQGGLAGLAFWVAGIKGAMFWSAVMMVLSLVPAVGVMLIWIPAVAYLGLTGEIVPAIGLALWCILVVGTIDNVLSPLLIGKDTEMPELLVLLTTLGGLSAFGIAGIVIGPLLGAVFMAMWRLWAVASEIEKDHSAVV